MTDATVTRPGRLARAFSAGFLGWLVTLVALVLAHSVLVNLGAVSGWSGTELAWRLVGAAGALMPFVAFAGGALAARLEPLDRRGLLELAVTVGLVGLVFYSLAAFATPTLNYERERLREVVDVSVAKPFGPETLVGRLRQRAYVTANPPSRVSYSTNRPLERPPNWLDYLIHRDVAMAFFAVLNTFLGFLAARALARDGPRYRRRVLWASGLASGVVIVGAMRAAEIVVRSSPTVSGVLMAWAPLVIPLAVLAWLARGPARPALAVGGPVAGERARV